MCALCATCNKTVAAYSACRCVCEKSYCQPCSKQLLSCCSLCNKKRCADCTAYVKCKYCERERLLCNYMLQPCCCSAYICSSCEAENLVTCHQCGCGVCGCCRHKITCDYCKTGSVLVCTDCMNGEDRGDSSDRWCSNGNCPAEAYMCAAESYDCFRCGEMFCEDCCKDVIIEEDVSEYVSVCERCAVTLSIPYDSSSDDDDYSMGSSSSSMNTSFSSDSEFE